MTKKSKSELVATEITIDFLLQFTTLLRQRWDMTELDYCILETIRNGGKKFNHSKAMLRSELTASMKPLDCGEANLVRMLNHLQDLGLLERLHFTLQERKQLFEDSPGNNRMGVCLTTKGQKVIDKIREAIINPSWLVNT